MRMQIFRVKKPSCKIFKTKNCVPFEVQYYSNGWGGSCVAVKAECYAIIYLSLTFVQCWNDNLVKDIFITIIVFRPFVQPSTKKHTWIIFYTDVVGISIYNTSTAVSPLWKTLLTLPFIRYHNLEIPTFYSVCIPIPIRIWKFRNSVVMVFLSSCFNPFTAVYKCTQYAGGKYGHLDVIMGLHIISYKIITTVGIYTKFFPACLRLLVQCLK